MRIGFLDCFAGVAGDMWVGALLDAGLGLDRLAPAVASLGLPGVEIHAERVLRAGLAGTRFEVRGSATKKPRRHLSDLLEIVDRADLPGSVVARARSVFELLAKVEARAHDQPREQVHFHEVGAQDTVVDVVCACLGLHLLGVERLYSSAVAVGRGTVRCEHGVLPVPAPGTLGALMGIPVRTGGPPFECTTPTGAALLAVCVTAFEPELTFVPGRIGYGAGARDPKDHPNLLRLTLGELADESASQPLLEIVCNLDTATGEHLAYVLSGLEARSALDAFATPVQMKKGRPGYQLTALASEAHREEIVRFLLEESTTLGVRMRSVARAVLERWQETVATDLGPVLCKVARLPSGSLLRRAEEAEVLRLAREQNLPRATVLARLAAQL